MNVLVNQAHPRTPFRTKNTLSDDVILFNIIIHSRGFLLDTEFTSCLLALPPLPQCAKIK